MGKERWRVIDEHPNYAVSDLGRVRNIQKNFILKPYDDGKGYYRVNLNNRSVRLHILVASAFLSNPDHKPIVNHKHGNKHDCRASQLEWVTASENTIHAYVTGLIKKKEGEVNGEAYLDGCTGA